MITYAIELVSLLFTALQLTSAIAPHSKHLTDEERFSYAVFMVDSGTRHKIDPYLIAAVAWHESHFTNLPKNASNDYGVMQVHWQKLGPHEKWLDGIKPQDLMDPRTNIERGTQELAHLRWFCAYVGHRAADHYWWAHYVSGVVVVSRSYDQRVHQRYGLLKPRPRRPPRSTS